MKFRKQLGNESVQDLIREASARVAELPPIHLYEPWPSDRRLEFAPEDLVVKTESKPQDK